MAEAPARATSTKRPRDRKQQIALAASQLFRDRGYHGVSMADVADAVGITAGALYRHFPSKSDLLYRAVLDGLEIMDATAREATDLTSYLRATGTVALDARGLPALWLRESRHLPDEQGRELRARFNETVEVITRLVAAERPDLQEGDVWLVTWAMIAVFGAFGVHRITLPKREFLDLHFAIAQRVVHAPLRGTAAAGAETGVAGAEHGSGAGALAPPRREQLIVAATRLFDQRGFQSVRIGDIGAAVGINGSSVYKHFTSKDELLVTAVQRGNERLQASMVEALEQSASPEAALRALLQAHIDFAIEHSALIGVLATERDELPEGERLTFQRFQRDYVGVWTRLLTESSPELSTRVAKMVVETVLMLVNSIARTRPLHGRADLGDRLLDLALAVLDRSADA